MCPPPTSPQRFLHHLPGQALCGQAALPSGCSAKGLTYRYGLPVPAAHNPHPVNEYLPPEFYQGWFRETVTLRNPGKESHPISQWPQSLEPGCGCFLGSRAYSASLLEEEVVMSHTCGRAAISGECFLGTGQCSEGAGELSVRRPSQSIDCQ